jgi:hypothetical protein
MKFTTCILYIYIIRYKKHLLCTKHGKHKQKVPVLNSVLLQRIAGNPEIHDSNCSNQKHTHQKTEFRKEYKDILPDTDLCLCQPLAALGSAPGSVGGAATPEGLLAMQEGAHPTGAADGVFALCALRRLEE